MMYTYQLEGLRWLYSLHKLQRGGILGECNVTFLGSTARAAPDSAATKRCHRLGLGTTNWPSPTFMTPGGGGTA